MARKPEVIADEPAEIDNSWPAWYHGPNGQSEIFDRAEDVPEGWVDHPSKVPPPEPIDL